MQKTHVEEYANQYFNELSDGEKQRVMIAKALAQDTPLIMLDEPTAHLDLPNRVEIMNILKQLAKDTHKAILLSTHELDLALQTADTIWLMNRNSKLLSGSPEDLVLSGAFEKVFAANSFDFDKHTGAFTVRHEIKDVVTLNGHGIQYLWTKKALQREGYQIKNMVPGHISIDIIQKGFWKAQIGTHVRNCNNVSELLSFLRHSAYYLKSSSNGSIETNELCPLQKNYMQ
jgi:iron complex transport system ATP-binding protein